MKKNTVVMSALMLASAVAFVKAQPPHPWLDQMVKRQRYPSPPGNSPTRGSADAPVTITEFLDFECPGSAKDAPEVRKTLEAYPTQVRLVFKNLPLEKIHPNARHKALVAECMGLQGKFWQAHDRFLAGAAPDQVTAGLDQGKLKGCVARGGEGAVDEDLALAKRLGLATTPSFVVDGIRNGGMMSFAQFKLLVDAELARKGGAGTH